MTAHRLSISVPEEVEESIRTAAKLAGLPVSTWIAQVAIRAARIEDGRRAVREYEAEHGPLPAHDRAEAQQALAAYGLTHEARAAS
jgi:hypothetical protein